MISAKAVAKAAGYLPLKVLHRLWAVASPESASIIPQAQLALSSSQHPELAGITARWVLQTGCTALGEVVVTQMDGKVPQPLSPLAKLLPLGIRSLGGRNITSQRTSGLTTSTTGPIAQVVPKDMGSDVKSAIVRV